MLARGKGTGTRYVILIILKRTLRSCHLLLRLIAKVAASANLETSMATVPSVPQATSSQPTSVATAKFPTNHLISKAQTP